MVRYCRECGKVNRRVVENDPESRHLYRWKANRQPITRRAPPSGESDPWVTSPYLFHKSRVLS
jgi:hypothetical protein